ncbi:MAG: hypothetical protein KDI37_00415 [Xanthomonadales bacterium]|nr:hypothetical protein [Xanthomonadales bacterium]MCB1640167.1 hypothetical protein [Xanthomonadales bacterium]
MSRMWQLFCTDEDPADTGSGSAWSGQGRVRMPLEHWQAIVDRVTATQADDGQWLEQVSVLDGRQLDLAACHRLLRLLDVWAVHIESGPPLMDLAPTDEIPEPMPPGEHARMLRDVARLLRRTLAAEQRFDSWVD